MFRFNLLAGCAILIALPSTMHAQPAKTTVLQAGDFTKEYATDQAAADKKYKLKTVTVEGVVDSFPKNKDGKKDVLLKGHEAGIGVFCTDLPADAVDKLKAGDQVRVSGLAAGKVGPFVVMATCKFVSDTGTPSKKPPMIKKETVVRGKAAEGLVTSKVPNWKVVGLTPNLAYISDRDYAIKKFPKEMDGGHVVVRDSGQINDWVQKGQLALAKDATLYVSMLVNVDGKDIVSKKQLDAMANDGWTFLKEPFESTTPDKSWQWKVASKPLQKGEVELPLPKEFLSFRTHAIYVFK